MVAVAHQAELSPSMVVQLVMILLLKVKGKMHCSAVSPVQPASRATAFSVPVLPAKQLASKDKEKRIRNMLELVLHPHGRAEEG